MTRIRRYLLFYCCLSVFVTITLLDVLIEEDPLFGYLKNDNSIIELEKFITKTTFFPPHEQIVEQFYKLRETWMTSNLGSYLFKNIDKNDVMLRKMTKKDQVFNVLVWSHWNWLKKRHRFGQSGCSVSNCKFTGATGELDTADAVIIHMQKGSIPYVPKRDPRQIWIFLTDESPRNTFSLAKNPPSLSMLDSVFNWSMTYRSDADIPVPYGRTLPLEYPRFDSVTTDNLQDLVPFWEMKQNTVIAAALMSNCAQFRMKYLKELQKHIDVHVYGKCGEINLTDRNSTGRHNTVIFSQKINNHTMNNEPGSTTLAVMLEPMLTEYLAKLAHHLRVENSCPGHVKKDCKAVGKYLFYLSFENSMCRQYLSEKAYQHAYDKGAIPVIMGPPIEDCRKLLPPNSFLHVDEFRSLRSLASEMMAISRSPSKILSYHLWRNNFKVIGEHGYFESQSSHLCRVCEALNYNDNLPKVYDLDELRLFLDPTILCLFGS